MKAGTRLSLALFVAVIVVGGLLAWLQWPLGGPDPEMETRMERIERLRTAVERELEVLEQARERREMTGKELRELRESLEKRQDEIERLKRELE